MTNQKWAARVTTLGMGAESVVTGAIVAVPPGAYNLVATGRSDHFELHQGGKAKFRITMAEITQCRQAKSLVIEDWPY